MDAQDHGANSARTRADGYGTLESAPPLVNGVDPGDRLEHERNEPSGYMEQNPNLFDPAPPQQAQPASGTEAAVTPEGTVELQPPYHQGELQPHEGLLQAITSTPGMPSAGDVNVQGTPNTEVQTQGFFTAESRTTSSPDQPTTRWTRVTEFLRTTASRGVHGVDRLLDNLGLNHGQAGTTLTSRAVERTVHISPPQPLPDLGGSTAAPPVPASWETGANPAPLFAREQLERMRQARRDHPLIYGQVSEVGSDNSSRLQAEVQRQLEEYAARYRDQVQVLQEEVRQLRDERARATATRPLSPPRPPLMPFSASPPMSNLPLPPSAPPPAPPQHSAVPGGQGCNLPQHSAVPGGQGCNLPQHSAVPGGQGCNLPQHSAVPGGQGGNLPQHSAVPGGQGGNLPQHSAVPGGLAQKHMQQATGSQNQSREGVQPPGSSAQQWLSGEAPDHIALLAGGMAQLQKAMLQQMASTEKGEDRSPEAVKPGTSSLPVLPAVHAETSSIDIADWLEMLAAPMADLSDGSSEWWCLVREKAMDAYNRWSNAGPMEKLAISPERDTSLEGGRWSRVNSRAASMIVLALHESVRSEMVARRLTGSTVSLLFRLMTLYQPGGQAERSRILYNLQSPTEESEPSKAVEGLRAWDRWLRRCRELSLATPDPTILSKGLSAIVRKVVEKNADMGFRTNLIRSTLQVDTRPSYESIDTYYKHLMAECEALAVSSSSLTTTSNGTNTTATASSSRPEPKMRPLKTEPKYQAPMLPTATSRSTTTPGGPSEHEGNEAHSAEKKDVPCRYFGKTHKGCARAGKCPFLHSWTGLEKEKGSRCLACGGKHMVKDCFNKKSSSPTATAKAQAQPKAAAQPTTSTSSSSTTMNKTVRVEEPSEAAATTSSQELGATDLKEVLADVGKMLKAMSTTSLKRATVAKDSILQRINDLSEAFCGRRGCDAKDNGEIGGLLDSGASNAMKPVTSEEYQKGIPVKVTLAGEEERVLRQNNQGTVLVEEKDPENSSTQPIVPLGALVQDLGCCLQWKKGNCKLLHPQRGYLKVTVKNNCPEVSLKEANKLIKELEANQVSKLNAQVATLTARLEVLRKEETKSWNELLKEYLEQGDQGLLQRAVMLCPFTKELPNDVQAAMVTDFDLNGGEKYLKEIPITRRKRRTLMASRDWVVRLFMGEEGSNDSFVAAVSKKGRVVLDVDVANSRLWDLHGPTVYKLLIWAASKGKIADIIGSPPETTWTSTIKGPRAEDSLYYRNHDHPYGVPELSALQQLRVNKETACVAKQLLLWIMAMIKGKRNVGFVVDFLGDNFSPSGDHDEPFSFWSTEMWKSFRLLTGMKTISFNQGAYGHRAERPTVMGTTYPMLNELNGEFDCGSDSVPQSLLPRSALRKWSEEFKWIVACAAMDYVPAPMAEEEEMIKCGARLSKLTKDEKEAWRQHLLQDHLPYRADCSVCLNAQATGYQYRRRRHPQLYSLALDLAGPFKVLGRDMECDDYKYIMVAAYKCPKEYMDAKAHDEVVKELGLHEYELSEAEGEDELIEADVEENKSDPEELEEEDKKEPLGPVTLEESVEELKEMPECTTVYITRSLRRRTKNEALRAAREIVLQLRNAGLYVSNLHTDRAREFSTQIFREWVAASSLRHTRTAGSDPAGNSTAELGVRWAKGRVRALLKSAGAEAKDWPMAISHASAMVWSRLFPHSPTTRTPMAPFGQEVWFRSKGYKGAKEKKHDPTGDRWKKGWYRGPSMDVSRGHTILRDDGGLTVAKGVRFNVIDPAKEFPDLFPPGEALEVPAKDQEETHHPTKKERKEEIEFLARKKMDEKDYTFESVLMIYERMEELGDTDLRIGKKTSSTSWFSGAYVHGGKAGTRLNLREYPNATKYLTEFGKIYANGKSFSALGIARNADLGLHRDSHNAKMSENIIVPLTEFEDGGLWLQELLPQEENDVPKELPNGLQASGKILAMEKGTPICFSPRLWHQVQPWKGDRVVFLMYTPRGTKLSEAHKNELKEAGFPLDEKILENQEDEEEDGNGEKDVKVMKAEVTTAFIEEEEQDIFQEVQRRDGAMLRNMDQDLEGSLKLAKMIKKAEVQYTANIEEILQDHIDKKKPLEVTHTVSLGEVRKALQKWAPSAEKEYRNLVENKKAFRPVKQSELPAGCQVVPCKGVFTVKPDGADGFRRKTRFVACGNHLAEGELTGADFDVYAAGLDATSLRTMLAFKTKKKSWSVGVTDIRQAFVLAPWIGKPVALRPPALAVELGLAAPDEYWLVLQSIYGLRESPAAWAAYRDNQLKAARWRAQVDGENVELRLEQLMSDNQVWRVVRADGRKNDDLGYLLVYIDDLMVVGPETVVKTFFHWLSNTWECDDLSLLSEDHPIKFLGMELHLVNGGVEVCQEGFIRELLRSHHHDGAKAKTQGPKELLIMSAEEEALMLEGDVPNNEGKERLIKEAQRRVGELLWLSSRSRPDIQYATAVMSSRITRCPEAVVTIGERILDYLNETIGDRLRFANDKGEPQHLRTYTDSSFAPSSGKSHGAVAIFYGTCPLSWRSSRQPLVALSTAETELMEGVEGAAMAYSTKCFLEELLDEELKIHLHIDNSAAISLMTTASGSWRTRHLRLRANWIKQKVQLREVQVIHEPGLTQKADIGTKPFSKDRLQQLKSLWNIQNRRVVLESSFKGMNVEPWMKALLVISQVCEAKGLKEGIQPEVPWDLYIVVIVLAIAVIGLWEAFKHCIYGRSARVKMLRVKAEDNERKKITRNELKELQVLMTREPATLDDEEKVRLFDLKEMFDNTMPANTSPVPTVPLGNERSSSSTASSTYNKQPKEPPRTKDQETQKDPPAFERVPPPPQHVRVYEGPFHQAEGRDVIHVYENCWGLRHVAMGRRRTVQMCRCCAENNGNRIY